LEDDQIAQRGAEGAHLGRSRLTAGDPRRDTVRHCEAWVVKEGHEPHRRFEKADGGAPKDQADQNDVDLLEECEGAVDDDQGTRVASERADLTTRFATDAQDWPAEYPGGEEDGNERSEDVAGRPPEGRSGCAPAEKDQSETRGDLHRALGEDDPQVDRDPPQRDERPRKQQHEALAEQRNGDPAQRPDELRVVVRGGDRAGGDEEPGADDERDTELQFESFVDQRCDRAAISSVFCDEACRRLGDAEVGRQDEERTHTDGQREDPVASRSEGADHVQGQPRRERRCGELDGQRGEGVAGDGVAVLARRLALSGKSHLEARELGYET